MRNLFPTGKPVGGNMLIGRNELLNELDSILGIGQSIVLIAPRRYGKTSVALAILEEFKRKGFFVGELDMFDVVGKRYMAEKILETCLKNNPVPLEKYWQKLKKGALNVLSMLKFKPSDDDIEVVLQLGMPSVNEEKILDDAFDFPERFCGRHKKQMIMFIDEFQEALKLGGSTLLKKMRAKMQRHKNVTYIFTGSQETLMTELFQHRQHAFYRFGRVFEIGTITREAFSPYITESFEGDGIKIGADAVDVILDSTAGHPYYTQLLCQMLYIDCLKMRKKSVNISDISSAEISVIEHESSLFDEIWKGLGDKKYSRSIVSLIAHDLSPYSCDETSKENVARILTDLVRYGYLYKTGAAKNIKYSLKDPFFKKYLLNK